MDRALINPIDRYEKPVTRIGQQAVGPGTKPTLGWACVPEAERGHFVKFVYELVCFGLVTVRFLYASNSVFFNALRRLAEICFHN